MCVQADLVQRLAEALQAAEKLAAEEKVVEVEDALDNVAENAVKAEGTAPTLAPGTQHVGQVLSAKVGQPSDALCYLPCMLQSHPTRPEISHMHICCHIAHV